MNPHILCAEELKKKWFQIIWEIAKTSLPLFFLLPILTIVFMEYIIVQYQIMHEFNVYNKEEQKQVLLSIKLLQQLDVPL